MSALVKYAYDAGIITETKTGLHFAGSMPVYASRFCPPDQIYITKTHMIVNTLDRLIWQFVLASVRTEAKAIVHNGLHDVRVWLGETEGE